MSDSRRYKERAKREERGLHLLVSQHCSVCVPLSAQYFRPTSAHTGEFCAVTWELIECGSCVNHPKPQKTHTHTGARVHMVLPKQPSHVRVSAGQTFKRLSAEQGKHKGILRNEHFLAIYRWRVSQKSGTDFYMAHPHELSVPLSLTLSECRRYIAGSEPKPIKSFKHFSL